MCILLELQQTRNGEYASNQARSQGLEGGGGGGGTSLLLIGEFLLAVVV